MPHVASQANVLHSQHAGLSRRERAAESGADTSPFSILLAETGEQPAATRRQPAKTQDTAPTQRSDTTRSDPQRTNAPRSDTQRSQRSQDDEASDAPADTTAAEAAPAEPAGGTEPDQSQIIAGDVEAVLETMTPVADGTGDPATDEVTTVDAVLTVAVEAPPPAEQPVVAATPSLAPVAPQAAAPATDATGDTDAVETAPVTGTTPAPVTAPAAATGEEAPPEPQQAQVPQAPDAQQQEAAQAPTVPTAPAKPHPKPAVEAPIASATTNTTTATPEQTDLATAPASPDIAASAQAAAEQPAEGEHALTPQHSEHAEKRSLPSAGPQAPEAADRPQPRSAVSEFVQNTQQAHDGTHLAHLQTGRDFGHTVAATAHASQSADASNPVVSAPVPLESVAVEIAARAQGGRNRFEIRLDPPELGRIEVRLDIDRSGNVTSRLVVDKVETLDVLRRDAHQLERALQDAGLKTSDNGLQFSLRDQSFAGRNDQGDSNRQQMHVVDPELPVTESVPTVYGQLLRGGSGIDIRV